MRVYAEYPVPDGTIVERGALRVADAPVTDPATGQIGNVVHADVTTRGGRTFVRLALEIDDDSAVVAALRDGGVF